MTRAMAAGEPEPNAAAGLSRDRAWLLALAATATMAVSYVDRQAFGVLAPTITKALALSEQQYSVLASAFSMAYLVGAPLAGRFVDRVGARRGLVASVLVWSAVAAAHALVPGFATLFWLRALLGLAEAPSFPAAAQTVSRALPPADRNAAFGVLFTGSSVGAMLAPPLVTALEARYGWRLAMVGTALVGLSWLPLWLWATRGAEVRALLSPPAAPMRYRWIDLLVDPAVLRAVVLVIASSPIAAFVFLWGAKVLVAQHALTQTQVGRYLWLPPLFWDAGALTFGALATARNRRLVKRSGAAATSVISSPRAHMAVAGVLASGIALLGLATTPWETTLVLALGLTGVGGVFALLTADMMMRVDRARVATAGGITAAAQSLAYIVVSPVIGYSATRLSSYAVVAAGLGLLVLPGCAAWLAWEPRSPRARQIA